MNQDEMWYFIGSVWYFRGSYFTQVLRVGNILFSHFLEGQNGLHSNVHVVNFFPTYCGYSHYKTAQTDA